ncbi:MAG: lysylphosphatidylglycerol synthase transmembrane domain-containing protein [Pseudomonadota bacterium]
MKSRTKKYTSIALRTLLVVASIWYLFHDVDLINILTAIKSIHAEHMLLVICLGFAQFVIQGLRLNILSLGIISWKTGVLASVVCVGLNSLLPAKIGEVAKLVVMKQNSKLNWDAGIRVLVWERFLDLNMLSFTSFLVAFTFQYNNFMWLLILGTISIWIAAYALTRWHNQVLNYVDKIQIQIIMKSLRYALSGFIPPPSRKVLTVSTIVTITLWIFMFIPDAVTYRILAGFDLTTLQMLTVFAVTIVGYSIPSTPGSIGVFDAAVVLGLGWFGIPKSEAIAAALILRAIHYIPSVLITLLYLTIGHVSLKNLYLLKENKAP